MHIDATGNEANLKFVHNDQMFFKLYDQYSTFLYRTICMWVDDRQMAQGLLFRTFLKIHAELLEQGFKKTLPYNSLLSIARDVTYLAIKNSDQSSRRSLFQ